MKISYNPKSSQNVIDAQSAANDDIIFDLKSSKLWAKGVRIGADWNDISNKPTSLKNPASIKFKDINGNVVTYDGSVAKDLTSGTYMANRLTTARNIALGTDLRGSANFDGSGNITINATINSCMVLVGSTNELPFKRIAHFETTSSNNDNALLLYISNGYINGATGICKVEFRTNNISAASAAASVSWLVRSGFKLDSLCVGYYATTNKAYIDIYLKTNVAYQGTSIRVLQDSRGKINSNVQLINASYINENNHKEAYSSIESAATSLYNKAYTKIVSGVDVGVVNYANSTGSTTKLQTAHKLWGQSFDGTADVKGALSDTGSITPSSAGAFDIGSNSLDYKQGYFQWLGSKTGTNLRLAANNSDNQIVLHTNGNVGIGTNSPSYKLQVNGNVQSSGFIKSNSSDAYVLLGGGGHKAESSLNVANADKLDGWHKNNIQWTGYISSNTANLQSYWFKIYDVTITSKQGNDVTITFLVSEGNCKNFSIFYLKIRQNGANGSGAYNLSVTLSELVGNLKNKIIAYYNNKTGNVQLWGNTERQYGVLNYTILKKTERVASDFPTLGTLTASYFNAAQSQPTTDYTKVTMSRVGQVYQAELSSYSSFANQLQTARKLWGNSFNGTEDIKGSIIFPKIGDTAISNGISWSSSSDGADIYYQTTAADQGNLVLNVKDDANAYIQLALNGAFKSHFDVANSYWTGTSSKADKWTTARTLTIGNSAKSVDGSGNVSWTLAEMGVKDTWRPVQVNGTSIGTNTLNLSNSTYIGVNDNEGKVTFNLIGSTTTANQAILSNGTVNGWKLETLNIANWNTAYNFVNSITGTDADNVINKWEEIVNFLAGITEDNKLNTLLNSKLSITQLAAKSDISTIKNNALYWVDTKVNASEMTNGPFTNSPFAMLSVTNYNTETHSYRSRLAFNDLGEIKIAKCHSESKSDWTDTWYNILTSNNSGISGSTIKLNGTSITVYSSGAADGRYVKKSGDTMTGALNFANNVWNKVGDDVAIGDCNVGGCLGIKAAITYPGIAFFNNANAHLGNLTAYSGNIKYGAYSLQFLDNGNTSVSASIYTNPFSAYDKNAVEDGQAICVWGQSSRLSNLASDSGDISLWLKRVNAKGATLNMVLDGEYYARGNQRLAHISEIPTSLKNPYALTISLNGTSQGPYDGSAAKSINITPGSIGAASADHNHDAKYLKLDGSNTMQGNLNLCSYGSSYIGKGSGDKSGADFTEANIVIRSWYGISFKSFDDKVRTYIDTRSGDIGTKGKFIGNLTGNADSATRVTVSQHNSNDINYPLVWSNQCNTGSAIANQLFKSWQDLYYNPKYKKLTVVGSVSTAYVNASKTVTSTGFVHSSVTENANQYVLTADGGYTRLNQVINEGEYSFSKDIIVTDQWTDIDGFYGGSDSFLVTNGTYAVQVHYKSEPANAMYDGYFSGIMSWYTGKTNSNNADEIVLHRAGHAYANTIYLRTLESQASSTSPYTRLQISANKTLSQNTYIFKFKRIC